MDKYARQSHKTNQRARRRNNTAQYLLENQLRQLDKDRRCEQVVYQRNLDRVKTELSNLEGISSDFDLPLHDNSKDKKYSETGYQQSKIKSHKDLNNVRDKANSSADKLEETFDMKTERQKVASSLSNAFSKEDGSCQIINEVPEYSKLHCLATSTPIDTLQENISCTRARSQISSIHSKIISCEYNHLNTRHSHICNYFPCRLPGTYHALGFRRDDLCPRNDDEESTPNSNSLSDDNNKLDPSSFRPNENFSKNSVNILNGQRKNIDTTTNLNTKWIKTNNESKSTFKPVVHGPVFGYCPTDPVLERIRQNRKEPKLNAVRPCARVTIKDRVRGVKQLVKEMKISNEKVKPEDWATNYGKRVPTRVLLNPVVPV